MKDEYDFSKGVRGKYAKQYVEGTNVILLDPDVAKEFPTSLSSSKSKMLFKKKTNVTLTRASTRIAANNAATCEADRYVT